ncbi:MAG: threonine ammonia-lyase [Betaproteobacteria bacterium]|nr:MAG: threonine ammonia-lyase [Betaproteobacteria bacterium]
MLRGIHSDTVLAEPHPQPLAGLRPTSDDIRRAAQRIAGQVEVTPFLHSRTLSRIAQAEVWLKFENLQFTASFKERGALNRLSTLSAQERSRGVIAMSAGNHAQGVAFHAQRMGIPAVIVMPRFAPSVKVERTRGFDAEVILAGDTFDDARVEAEQLVQSRGLTMVHPYDDVDVIAGQGTVGAEMLAAQPDLQCLCVAVGGGGLISGVAIAARSVRPDIEVIGVQTDRFPAMYAAVKGVTMPCASATLAEGIAVKSPGALTTAIVRRLVDDVLLVNEGDIEHAIVLLLEIEKTVVEGAGAAGLAALLRHPGRFRGRRVGLILSGGNIEPMMLADIIERGMVRAGRLARIRVTIRDIPGELARAAAIVGQAGANIEEVAHQRAFTTLPVLNAELEMEVQTRGPGHIEQVLQALRAAGLPAELYSG